MKKILLSALLLVAISATGCSKDEAESPYDYTNNPVEMGNALVVYFSRTGTTQTVANHIVELTGAEVFRIEPVVPYPSDYDETTQVARREKDNNARPEIVGTVENMDEYNTVFVGFPIWWGSRPMLIATFLESYDLQGKNIIPFTTHGGGGYADAFAEVVAHTPGSTHVRGLATQGAASRGQVESWLNQILLSY